MRARTPEHCQVCSWWVPWDDLLKWQLTFIKRRRTWEMSKVQLSGWGRDCSITLPVPGLVRLILGTWNNGNGPVASCLVQTFFWQWTNQSWEPRYSLTKVSKNRDYPDRIVSCLGFEGRGLIISPSFHFYSLLLGVLVLPWGWKTGTTEHPLPWKPM